MPPSIIAAWPFRQATTRAATLPPHAAATRRALPQSSYYFAIAASPPFSPLRRHIIFRDAAAATPSAATLMFSAPPPLTPPAPPIFFFRRWRQPLMPPLFRLMPRFRRRFAVAFRLLAAVDYGAAMKLTLIRFSPLIFAVDYAYFRDAIAAGAAFIIARRCLLSPPDFSPFTFRHAALLYFRR